MTGLAPPLEFLRDLVFTADTTLEEPEQTPEIPTESKQADDFKVWRIATDFYHLLIQIQIAIINLQTQSQKQIILSFMIRKNCHHHPLFR